MHVVIINGSPRIQKNSNTDKIITSFTEGMCENNNDYELFCISDRSQWAAAKDAFENTENNHILIALPLFVECIPGMLLEFLGTLTPKTSDDTVLSFILQSGFAEGNQLRCGEAFLEKLPEKLNCKYGGTLVKGDNFGIRLMNEDIQKKMTSPYVQMGRIYSRDQNFFSDEAKKFTGPEQFGFMMRLMLSIIQKSLAKSMFKNKAKEVFGCTQSLSYKPYDI